MDQIIFVAAAIATVASFIFDVVIEVLKARKEGKRFKK